MQSIVAVGRFFIVVLFIFSGASKLLDIATTAQTIAAKVFVPPLLAPIATMLAPVVTQIEALTGMPFAQLLAIAVGLLELVGGALIAFNLGARWLAVVLALFVVVATVYFHDFWNQVGPERFANLIHSLKNLSIVGALLMIAGLRPPERAAEKQFEYS